MALKVEAGSLLVRNGFTHHPQEREEFRFFKGSLDLPPQIIMLDGSGNVTFDVLNWLAEKRVTLARLTWRGRSRQFRPRERLKAVAEGYDPTIGIMQEGGDGAAAFIFFIMEAQRALVDRSILHFVRNQTFHPVGFGFGSHGVIRLNPQLARTIVSMVQ